MEEQKTKRCVWRDEDTWKLIQLWRSNFTELRRTRRNKIVYENMCRELNSNGLNIGTEEIRNKIKNLSKKFREEFLLAQNPDGNYKSEWKFYNSIQRILGHRTSMDDYNLSYDDPVPEIQSRSWLTIVSEPDLSIVKTETEISDDNNTIEDEEHFLQQMDNNESMASKMHRRLEPEVMLHTKNDADPLDVIEQSDSDQSQYPVSTSLENNKRKTKQLKRKYALHSEILSEIKRSNQIAEKNDQMALILAAEANKLLDRSNKIQEQLLNLLSSRL